MLNRPLVDFGFQVELGPTWPPRGRWQGGGGGALRGIRDQDLPKTPEDPPKTNPRLFKKPPRPSQQQPKTPPRPPKNDPKTYQEAFKNFNQRQRGILTFAGLGTHLGPNSGKGAFNPVRSPPLGAQFGSKLCPSSTTIEIKIA